jgi:hypothetical protein
MCSLIKPTLSKGWTLALHSTITRLWNTELYLERLLYPETITPGGKTDMLPIVQTGSLKPLSPMGSLTGQKLSNKNQLQQFI